MRGQEAARGAGSATFFWSAGPGAQQEMRGGQGVGGDSRWAVPPGRASGEGIVLLLPVGALAGLLLTKESLDLRHPLRPAPAVPAFNTDDAEPSEKQKAYDPPYHRGQELWPGPRECCGQNLDLGFQQDFVFVPQ